MKIPVKLMGTAGLCSWLNLSFAIEMIFDWKKTIHVCFSWTKFSIVYFLSTNVFITITNKWKKNLEKFWKEQLLSSFVKIYAVRSIWLTTGAFSFPGNNVELLWRVMETLIGVSALDPARFLRSCPSFFTSSNTAPGTIVATAWWVVFARDSSNTTDAYLPFTWFGSVTWKKLLLSDVGSI